MKRWVFVLLAVLVVSFSAFAAEKLLFEDDFEDELDLTMWFPLSDEWQSGEGALVFPNVSFGDIFGGEEDWENYAVECEILPIEFGTYGSIRIFVRSNELWNGYGVSFHTGGFMVHRFEGNWDIHTIFANETSPTFLAGVPLQSKS